MCDRADRPTILKISADHVRIQIKSGISSEGANEEILVRFPYSPALCSAACLHVPQFGWFFTCMYMSSLCGDVHATFNTLEGCI